MKLFPLLLGLFLLSSGSGITGELKPGFYSAFDDDGAGFTEVSNEQGKADHQLGYLMDDTLDIGIGELRDGLQYTKTFQLKELEHYFERQKHKGFVAVLFHKAAPSNRSLEDTIKELEKFFFGRGYGRVLFLGARGSGVQVYKDSRRGEQNSADQSAPRSASKRDGSDNPRSKSEACPR